MKEKKNGAFYKTLFVEFILVVEKSGSNVGMEGRHALSCLRAPTTKLRH